MSNRLTIKGQVTIPKAVRDHLGLQEGCSSVEFVINADGSVTVRKAGAEADLCAQPSANSTASRGRVQRRDSRASALRAASHRGVLALLAGGL